jgi:hypothetical protein
MDGCAVRVILVRGELTKQGKENDMHWMFHHIPDSFYHFLYCGFLVKFSNGFLHHGN